MSVTPGQAPAIRTRYVFRFPLETDEELRTYLKVSHGVVIPDEQICEKHSTPWRAFADAYFARTTDAVWEGSRGFAGKSFQLSTLSTIECETLGAQVNVIAGSGAQSKRVLEVQEELWAWPDAPRWILRGLPGQMITRFKNGGRIRALTASPRAARGPHPQRLRADEVDEMKLKILDAALGMTMDKTFHRPSGDRFVPMQNVLSSTHQYARGTMTEVKERAEKNGTPIYQWCYRETLKPHGWLDPAQVTKKRKSVPEYMWLNEYELQEPAPASRAFGIEHVERMFDEKLGKLAKGDEGEAAEFEPPLFERSTGKLVGRYVHGVDWARKRDWTIVVTLRIDVKPWRVVSYYRGGRTTWPQMLAVVEKRWRRYRGPVYHDALGVGDVAGGVVNAPLTDVFLVGRDRQTTLNEYVAGVERDEIKSPKISWMYGEHKWCSVADLFHSSKDDEEDDEPGGDASGKKKQHLPDTVCAMALAYKAAKAPWPSIH